jgi:hypothetical protein
MTIQIFEKELVKIQDKFNELFGNLSNCDVQMRSNVILCIVGLGLLNRKIRNASNRNEAREEIRKFIKHRDIINNYFKNVQENLEERRRYASTDKSTKSSWRKANRGS